MTMPTADEKPALPAPVPIPRTEASGTACDGRFYFGPVGGVGRLEVGHRLFDPLVFAASALEAADEPPRVGVPALGALAVGRSDAGEVGELCSACGASVLVDRHVGVRIPAGAVRGFVEMPPP